MEIFFNKNKALEEACKETRVKEYIKKYMRNIKTKNLC